MSTISHRYMHHKEASVYRNSRKWDVVLFHFIVVVFVTLTLYLDNPSYTLIVGGMVIFPSYFLIGLRESQRSPLWFTPLSFYFFWYSVSLGLSAIYAGIITYDGDWIPFSVEQVSPDDIAKGYIIYLWSSLFLHAGIQIFRPFVSGLDNSIKNKRYTSLKWFVFLWLIGLLVLWKPHMFAPLGFPGRVLRWGSLAALSAFVLIPKNRLRISDNTFYVLMILGTAGLFAVNLMSYSKAYIMYSFLPLLWFLIVHRSLHWVLPFLLTGFLLFYLTVVAPVVTIARYDPLPEDSTPAEHLVKTFTQWKNGVSGLMNKEFYSEQLDSFFIRMFDATPVGYLVGEVDTYGYEHGSTMEYAAYAFIPRIIWPEKPTVTQGGWFAYYVGFAESPEQSTMSLGITATGELYLNFGVIGVLVGMFIIGCLIGKFWHMVGVDPRESPIHMLFYVLIMLSMNNMSEAVTVIATLVGAFIVYNMSKITIRFLKVNR